MLAVFLTKERKTFLQWRLHHMIDCTEIFSFEELTNEYTHLLTDEVDIPETFAGKVLHIGDIDSLVEDFPVFALDIGTSILSNATILNIMDSAYQIKESTPIPEVYVEPIVTAQPISAIQITTRPVSQPVPIVNVAAHTGEIIDLSEFVPMTYEPDPQPPIAVTDLRPAVSKPIKVQLPTGIKVRQQRVLDLSTLVYTFGITPRSGTTMLTYLIANYLASINPTNRVLLIDMDISSGALTKQLQSMFDFEPDTSCNLMQLAQLSEEEYIASSSMLIKDVPLYNHSSAQLSLILHNTTSFVDKRMLASYNFTNKLAMLKDMFDYVIVDCGRLISSMDYQVTALSTSDPKLFVVDGSTREAVLQFIQDVLPINIKYQIAMNRTARTMTPIAIQQQLGKQVLATIPQKNSLAASLGMGCSVLDLHDNVLNKNLESIVGGI